MDPTSFKEFLVYFPHDKELVVMLRREIIFKDDDRISLDSQIILEAIYEGQLYSCILVQCAKEEGDICESSMAAIRKMKEKMKLSSLLEKVPRYKSGRFRVPPLNVSRHLSCYGGIDTKM